MSNRHEHGLHCGRRAAGLGAGAREPFAFPGTERRYAPDRPVDVRHTRLEIRLDPAVAKIEGVVRHTVAALGRETKDVEFHAQELAIDRVQGPDGRDLPFRHDGRRITIDLDPVLGPGEETTVSIAYHGTPRRGIYFIGPEPAYPDKPVQAWTQGQDEDSRFWFPCFDHPSEKASTEVLARVPSRYTVVSNGALVSRVDNGDGTSTWHWRQAVPHCAYLVTLVVGDFEVLTLRESRVPLTAYVPKGRLEHAKRAFGRTPEMVDLFEERFGLPFPYEKYAQVVVEDFIFGGMENTTATTLIDQAIYDDRAALDFDADDLIAHELAHQWWGDLLTCRDWSHAWLNEGFATWCELVFKEHRLGEDEAAYDRHGMTQMYLEEDGGEYRRAIVDRRYEEPIDLFDRHLYEKGCWVLHMLRRELGEDAFWRAIRTYAAENRGRTVVTEDLRKAIEHATGRDLDWFFDQWIYRGGHPEINFSWTHDKKRGVLALNVRQTQTGDDLTPEAFRFTVAVELEWEGGRRETRRIEVSRREHTIHVPSEKAPERVRFDPGGDLLATLEIEQPPEAHRAVLASDRSVMSRVRAASALAKDATEETAAALVKALHDPFWGVGAEAARALGKMRTPRSRDALTLALRTVKHPKARRAAAEALSSFRHDEAAGAALRRVLKEGDPSLFVEAAAAASLGATRVPSAREDLRSALLTKDSWAEMIRLGCLQGLGALGSEEALPLLMERLAHGQPTRIRAGAAMALAAVGRRLAVRDPIREALMDLLAERDFRILMAGIRALRSLGDDRAIPALLAAAEAGVDGRVRRAARAAAGRLRKGADRSTEVARISDDLDLVRKRNADLLMRLERLESRLGPTGSVPG